jgi:hypothetical protein
MASQAGDKADALFTSLSSGHLPIARAGNEIVKASRPSHL